MWSRSKNTSVIQILKGTICPPVPPCFKNIKRQGGNCPPFLPLPAPLVANDDSDFTNYFIIVIGFERLTNLSAFNLDK